MAEAREADGYYDFRKDQTDDEVVDYDPNDGEPDEVQHAIAIQRTLLESATSAESDTARPRDFNWKFQKLPLATVLQLKHAKHKLSSEAAAMLLIAAAQEVNDEQIAA